MFAGVTADIAALVAAAAGLVLALTVWLLVWRRGLRSVAIDMPGLKAKVEAMDAKVDQINSAVNHQPEGAATLVQRVQKIERNTTSHRKWEVEVMQLIGKQLGVDIPPPPDQEDS